MESTQGSTGANGSNTSLQQRFQQQLRAHYNHAQQQQQQQQQGMTSDLSSGGGSGGGQQGLQSQTFPSHAQFMTQSQQRLMQQQQQQQSDANPSASLQQVQQQHTMNNPMASAALAANPAAAAASIYSHLGAGPAFAGQGAGAGAGGIMGNLAAVGAAGTTTTPTTITPSPMDASSGSSARLMALSAGLGMAMDAAGRPSSNTTTAMQNVQTILSQQAAAAAAAQQNPLGQPNMAAAAAAAVQQQMLLGNPIVGRELAMQQFANLQRQMQQQQGTSTSHRGGMSGNMAAAAAGMMQVQQQPQQADSQANLLQARQQQLLQQMQQQPRRRKSSPKHHQDSSTGTMMGLQQPQLAGMQVQQQPGTSTAGSRQQDSATTTQTSMPGGTGPLSEAQLRLRQQNIMRGSSTSSSQQKSIGPTDSKNRGEAGMSTALPHGMSSSVTPPTLSQAHFQNMAAAGMPGAFYGQQPQRSISAMTNPSIHAQSNGQQQQQQQQQRGAAAMTALPVHSQQSTGQQQLSGSSMQSDRTREEAKVSVTDTPVRSQQIGDDLERSNNKSSLDSSFAGGWQSNGDLPDRRRIIFHILELVRDMRPESRRMPESLPHMAKILEEHLYRSARSKEDYVNMATLKDRLQYIAHGLELYRTSSPDASVKSQQSHSQAIPSPQQQGFGQSKGAPPHGSEHQNALWQSGHQSDNAAVLSGHSDTSNLSGQLQAPNQVGSQQEGVNLQAAPSNTSEHTSSAGNAQLNPQDLIGGQQQSGAWALGQPNAMGAPQSTMMAAGNVASVLGQASNLKPRNFSSVTTELMASRGVLTDVAAQQQLSAESTSTSVRGAGGSETSSSSRFHDPAASVAQKKRIIQQQQQRLLLLRHASKCKAGASCPTKFCSQMVTLWKHLKTCRNKSCRTSHCVSSRCVLNHYRICKSNGRTSSCEVCGPVMAKIKQLERDPDASDPLAREQEQDDQSIGSLPRVDNEQTQLEQLQSQQKKLQARLENLQLLRKQQDQLLEQQKRLQVQARNIKDPNSQQAQQLQEQQVLLSQLQKRCQQQQHLLQHELQEQSGSSGGYQTQQMPGMQTVQASAVPDTTAKQPEDKVPEKSRSRTGGKGTRGGKGTKGGKGAKGGKGRRGSLVGKDLRGHLDETQDDSPKPAKKRTSGVSSAKEKSQKKLKITAAASFGPKTSGKKGTQKGSGVHGSEAGTSLITCMTRDDINKHLESLNKRIRLSSRTVTHKCLPIMQKLIDDQYGWVFQDPVDPVALGLPDYFDVVKNPMHLELVKKKLENAIYSDMESFARDVKLVFDNAILYNGESSEVGELAQSMLSKFEKLYNSVVQGIETSQQLLENKGEACSLCGLQKRRFEPTVLYCQGKCRMQRIKRHAQYFTDRTKQNHWCDVCYEQLDPVEPIALDDGSEVFKKDLQEFKNDALPEEGWVNCDECHSWVHQICALFNGRTNRSTATYTCPNCCLNKAAPADVNVLAGKSLKGAQDLTQCNMSRAIEKGLADSLQLAYSARAKELGVGVDQVEKAEGLTVRVLSNVEKRHFVGDEMAKYYSAKGCPTEFPVRSKCIGLFQRIHGVDTLLFALYVYEYGHECPAPNKRRVYISYLDSAQYFEPKCYRTEVYHAILVEYLRYVKARGFHTAHVWSCPPTPGDEYIFYCHPEYQKIPREDMLRAWYDKMLNKAKAQGIVIRTTTLYDEYFASDVVDPVPIQRFDARCLPYFEGDYIPGEIETIIRQLEGEDNAHVTTSASRASRDDVMHRLGHNLHKMKDNFIVVHLRNRRFAAAVERGEDVSNWQEDSDEEVVRSKRAKISGKDSSAMPPKAGRSLAGTLSLSAASEKSRKTADAARVLSASEMKPAEENVEPKEQQISSGKSPDTQLEGLKVITAEAKDTRPNEADPSSFELPHSSPAKEKPSEFEKPKEPGAALNDSSLTAKAAEEKLTDAETAPKEASMAEIAQGSAVDENPTESEIRRDVASIDEKKEATAAGAKPMVSEKDLEEKAADLNSFSGDFVTKEASEVEDKLIDAKTVAEYGSPKAETVEGKSADSGTVSNDAPRGEASHDRLVEERPVESETIWEKASMGQLAEGKPVISQAAPTDAANTEASVALDITMPGEGKSPAAASTDATNKAKDEDGLNLSEVETTGAKAGISASVKREPRTDGPSSRGLEEIGPAISRHFAGLKRPGTSTVSDTSDPDEPTESGMFESRQQFLNYCQTTHCQFDELRRAKHSTIMLLFQLHNPEAPKFLQQCGACYVDITHGTRYHCNDCPDFDLCHDCYEPVITGLWAKRDARFAHDPSHTFTPVDMEATTESRMTGEERQKALKTHVALVEHAADCQGPPVCSLQNCHRMKRLFEHVPSCDIRPKRNCKICSRLLSLCAMHARMCPVRDHCTIPFCDRIRERYMRLRRQQQLMDDRRRQAQNELYHAGGA